MEMLKLARMKKKTAVNKCNKTCGTCRHKPRCPWFHQTNASADESTTDKRVSDAPTNAPNKEATDSTPHATGLGTASRPEVARDESPQESDSALCSVTIQLPSSEV